MMRRGFWLWALLAFLVPTMGHAAINGFMVNSISALDDLTLNDRFGTSATDYEHKVNYADCESYNGEISSDLGIVTGALEGSGEAQDAAGSDDTNTSVADTTTPEEDVVTNPSDLPEDVGKVRFDVGMTAPIGANWYYAVKMGSCDTGSSVSSEETSTCKTIIEKTYLTTPSSILFDIDVRYLIGTKTIEADVISTCSEHFGTSSETRIYVMMEQEGFSFSPTTSEILIEFDYDPPATPEELEANPGETNISLSWTDDDNSAESDIRYQVYYSTESFTDEDKEQVFIQDTVATTSDQIKELENDVSYFFRVSAIDNFDNESPLSDEVEGIPVPVNDFFDQYKSLGGREEGGYCAASTQDKSSTGFFWLLGILGSLMFVRKRWSHANLWLLAIVLGMGTLAFPSDSHAYEPSPQNWNMTWRFGTYLPNIDSEFLAEQDGPYEQIFDSSSFNVYRIEMGYKVFDLFGKLYISAEFGYGRAVGKGIEVASEEESSDTTKMHFLPLNAGLSYQMDYLTERYRFPLIPYVRGGFAYTIWWATDGVGETSQFEPEEGSDITAEGATMGYHISVGLRLLLDGFDKTTADSFDEDMGFNNSYLFIEWSKLSLDDFGRDTSFVLSDELISFGLAFDF
jgi:hypothetical protein